MCTFNRNNNNNNNNNNDDNHNHNHNHNKNFMSNNNILNSYGLSVKLLYTCLVIFLNDKENIIVA